MFFLREGLFKEVTIGSIFALSWSFDPYILATSPQTIMSPFLYVFITWSWLQHTNGWNSTSWKFRFSNWAANKKTSYFSFYWLFNGDPYTLYCFTIIHNPNLAVKYNALYTLNKNLNNKLFFHCSIDFPYLIQVGPSLKPQMPNLSPPRFFQPKDLHMIHASWYILRSRKFSPHHVVVTLVPNA